MKLSLAMPKAVEEPQDMGQKKQLSAFLAAFWLGSGLSHADPSIVVRMGLASTTEKTSVSPIVSSQPEASK